MFFSSCSFIWESYFSFWKCIILRVDFRLLSWVIQAFISASIFLLISILFRSKQYWSFGLADSVCCFWDYIANGSPLFINTLVVDWIETKFLIYFGFESTCSVRILLFWERKLQMLYYYYYNLQQNKVSLIEKELLPINFILQHFSKIYILGASLLILIFIEQK